MSLTDQAVKAISEYRTKILSSPTNINNEVSILRRRLEEIGRQDRNIFYTVNRESFLTFPLNESFDRDEYLTFRYLFESSYAVRRVLVRSKRQQLEKMAQDLLNGSRELSREYELEYNQLSIRSAGKRTALKAEAQLNGISSSRLFFAIKRACELPDSLGVADRADWIRPDEYKRQLHREFKAASQEIGVAWGMSPRLADYYIRHIEIKKSTEKAAIVSAIAGGTVLAAWGLSRAFQASNEIMSAGAAIATVGATIPFASRDELSSHPIKPLYGLENFAAFMAMPSNQLTANQAGFLNHLQNLGTTNAHAVQLAGIQSARESAQAIGLETSKAISQALTQQYDYGRLGPAVSESLGLKPMKEGAGSSSISSTGNLLGAGTNLTINDMGNTARISGFINGQHVMTNVTRIGNLIKITGY